MTDCKKCKIEVIQSARSPVWRIQQFLPGSETMLPRAWWLNGSMVESGMKQFYPREENGILEWDMEC